MPVKLSPGYYRLNVIMNWGKVENDYDVKFEGAGSIHFKESSATEKHENFLFCVSEESRSKGKCVKDEETKLASCLYHEPKSNLVIVSMINQGDQNFFNMNLENTKEQHNYQIINPKGPKDE
jgi:hypothetical protein